MFPLTDEVIEEHFVLVEELHIPVAAIDDVSSSALQQRLAAGVVVFFPNRDVLGAWKEDDVTHPDNDTNGANEDENRRGDSHRNVFTVDDNPQCLFTYVRPKVHDGENVYGWEPGERKGM